MKINHILKLNTKTYSLILYYIYILDQNISYIYFNMS